MLRRCSDIDGLWGSVRPRSQQGIRMRSPRRPDERPTAAPAGVLETVDRHHVDREVHRGRRVFRALIAAKTGQR